MHTYYLQYIAEITPSSVWRHMNIDNSFDKNKSSHLADLDIILRNSAEKYLLSNDFNEALPQHLQLSSINYQGMKSRSN